MKQLEEILKKQQYKLITKTDTVLYYTVNTQNKTITYHPDYKRETIIKKVIEQYGLAGEYR